MKQVRLIAYRNATTSSTTETSYELDLQENPSVSLNFQFSDIKEPETRKASYSQTFKLPFTDNNNEFFQNWFNVNLDTLVFTTRKKFTATLFVGATPQFEGIIQLKAVYQKSQLYEVVLMSNAADLFTIVGQKKLRDIYRNSNGSWNEELNHTYTQTNIVNSWNGTSSAFQNLAGASLQDSTGGVQKVMYPMSLTKPNFYYDVYDPYYLNMTQADMENTSIFPDTYLDAQTKMVELTQLRPAVQIRTILERLFIEAGFTWTSTFLDSVYFRKLFMTTCGHLGEASIPCSNTTSQPGGEMTVGNSTTFGTYTADNNDPIFPEEITQTVLANTTSGWECILDYLDIWNEQYNYFEKKFVTMQTIQVTTILSLTNVSNLLNSPIIWSVWLAECDENGVETGATFGIPAGLPFFPDTSDYDMTLEQMFTLSLNEMGVGQFAKIKMTLENAKAYGGDATIVYGSGQLTCANVYSKISLNWLPFNQGPLNGEVNVPFCIDETILQKDFLSDLIQRFNLIVLSDPNSPTNLIIEPYDDYLDGGSILAWSKKLDTSKEIIIKDTTSIQKKTLIYTDQEDVDLGNKSVKEEYPDTNVYGHYRRDNETNDFATGEMKTKTIFSPFINQKVYAKSDTNLPTQIPNMTVQYEFTYKAVDNGFENSVAETKPKLFYYCGTPTAVLGIDGNALSGGYNMHHQNVADAEIDVYNFTTYPVCSPFDIIPSSNVYTMTGANKSLYWNDNPPPPSDLTVFNVDNETNSWFQNSLYGLYWKNYIDNLYHQQARIMECYLNLDEVDIHNFSFNDQVFIKDSYWRVLDIKNYQVGQEASTKVTLLKVIDELTSTDCDYVVGSLNGSNLFFGFFYYWCPASNPGCTPTITMGSDLSGLATTQECCEGVGGSIWDIADLSSYNVGAGLFPCQYNSGSLPIRLRSLFAGSALVSQLNIRNIFANKLGTLEKPLIIGSNTGKDSQAILPYYADDYVIKYNTQRKKTPRLLGEVHRIVMTGFTEGNTRGYAHPHGTNNVPPLPIPNNSNMLVRVNGIVTVVGGTSSTYVVGTTDSFGYYTSFVNRSGTIVQQGTAGGTNEFNLHEGVFPTTCTLNIVNDADGFLEFGLDDDQTDTKRIWSLSIEISVQRLQNLIIEYKAKYALYQNSNNIAFQDGKLLVWN